MWYEIKGRNHAVSEHDCCVYMWTYMDFFFRDIKLVQIPTVPEWHLIKGGSSFFSAYSRCFCPFTKYQFK